MNFLNGPLLLCLKGPRRNGRGPLADPQCRISQQCTTTPSDFGEQADENACLAKCQSSSNCQWYTYYALEKLVNHCFILDNFVLLHLVFELEKNIFLSLFKVKNYFLNFKFKKFNVKKHHFKKKFNI